MDLYRHLKLTLMWAIARTIWPEPSSQQEHLRKYRLDLLIFKCVMHVLYIYYILYAYIIQVCYAYLIYILHIICLHHSSVLCMSYIYITYYMLTSFKCVMHVLYIYYILYIIVPIRCAFATIMIALPVCMCCTNYEEGMRWGVTS